MGRRGTRFPSCFQTGNVELVYANPRRAGRLALEFTCVIDPSAATVAERFGRLRAMTAAALPQ